jgi:large conductance mechanosensitive channel
MTHHWQIVATITVNQPLVVRPVNALMERFKKPEPEVSEMRDCPFCMSSISKQATRCPYCTSEVQAVASA